MGNSKAAQRQAQRSASQGKIALKGLDVLHEGWVLKKKRKKMQGERRCSF
jgi:hypothetical protein